MKCKETWIKNLMAITDYMIDKRNITQNLHNLKFNTET